MSMGINSSQMMIKVSQKILIFQPGPGCIETSVLTSGCTIMLLMLKFAGNKLIIVRPDGSFSLLLDVHRNYSLVIEQMTSMYRVRTLLRITDRWHVLVGINTVTLHHSVSLTDLYRAVTRLDQRQYEIIPLYHY